MRLYSEMGRGFRRQLILDQWLLTSCRSLLSNVRRWLPLQLRTVPDQRIWPLREILLLRLIAVRFSEFGRKPK